MLGAQIKPYVKGSCYWQCDFWSRVDSEFGAEVHWFANHKITSSCLHK